MADQPEGALRRGWLSPWVRAALSVARDSSTLLAKRARVRRRRVVADRDLLVGGPLPFREALARGRLERAVLAALDSAVGAYLSAARFVL